MYRVDHFTGITTLPAPTPALTNEGLYFTGGNPGVGGVGFVASTKVELEWLNMIQEELCNVVKEAGEELDKSDRTQLARCIQTIGNPSGGGPSTSPRIFEPPANGLPYSRGYEGLPATSGFWERAIQEPDPDNVAYARRRVVGQTVGEWVATSGRGRVIDDMTFYVRRGGDNANDGEDPARAWADIQFAVDAVTGQWDAGDGNTITIDVGDDGGTPWDGFIVTQPLLNAPRMGFRIQGSTSAANKTACRIGASITEEYEGYTVYANGTRVVLSNLALLAPAPGGAVVAAVGSDTTLWFDTAIYFYPHTNPNATILATEGALIIVDRDASFTPGTYGPNQQDTYRGMLQATLCGQIILESTRSEMGVSKGFGRFITENTTISGNTYMWYCGNGGIMNFGTDGLWDGISAGNMVIRSTGCLTGGERYITSTATYRGLLPLQVLGGGSYNTGGSAFYRATNGGFNSGTVTNGGGPQ
jgi:hypothetical protein